MKWWLLIRRSLTIKSRWPVAPAGGPTAFALDLDSTWRLFSAGRNPQMLVVMDADSGHVIQSFPISGGVDAAAYEPETGLVFVSTREGMIHVFHEDSPDKFSEVETVKTEFGELKPWDWIPRRTISLWILLILVRPPSRPQTGHVRNEPRFPAHSTYWFMANEAIYWISLAILTCYPGHACLMLGEADGGWSLFSCVSVHIAKL